MNWFLLFFCFFAASCLVCAVLVIFSKNPVFAVLFLVLCFCNVSALLFLLCLEFVPVTFIIIYVGAIAVLFLFVLMMLNINISEISKVRSHIASIAAVVSLIFFIELLVLTHFEFWYFTFSFSRQLFVLDFVKFNFNLNDFFTIFVFNDNIQLLGRALFVEYAAQFIITGFILLLAMIATITLTIQKAFLSKSQDVYHQILRKFNDQSNIYTANLV